MKYVVDSSVAFKWVVAEVDDDKANRLRESYRNNVHELIAPDIFPAEIANALLMA
jgi:predicted nucleic acid-binding protein